MSDPPRSDIDFENNLASVWTTLKLKTWIPRSDTDGRNNIKNVIIPNGILYLQYI